MGRQPEIYNYFMVSDDCHMLPLDSPSFTIDATLAIFCTQGSIAGAIDSKHFCAQSPCLLALSGGQKVEIESISSDFSAWFIVMSVELCDDLYTQVKQNMVSQIPFQTNPVLPMQEVEMRRNVELCQQLYSIIADGSNPFKKEIIKHLITAMYFMQHADMANRQPLSKKDDLMVRFVQMVKDNYKRERRVQFYGSELCMSPKYLSQIVKAQTGKTAAEWIDSYVVAEAKALLRSSELSIMQISSLLHFPDQSSFGKYFKVHEGLSPKDYRTKYQK